MNQAVPRVLGSRGTAHKYCLSRNVNRRQTGFVGFAKVARMDEYLVLEADVKGNRAP